MDSETISMFPGLEMEELNFIAGLIKDLDPDKKRAFASLYIAKRKDAQLILILALVGFLGFSGIHRFITNQIGMGILYFFTMGLCFIGTIVDMVNYRSLAFEYNQKMASEALSIVNM
jgi:TM2 domain-containing membrane protein YozV